MQPHPSVDLQRSCMDAHQGEWGFPLRDRLMCFGLAANKFKVFDACEEICSFHFTSDRKNRQYFLFF